MTYPEAISHAADAAAWAYVLRPITAAIGGVIVTIAALGSVYLGVLIITILMAARRFPGGAP